MEKSDNLRIGIFLTECTSSYIVLELALLQLILTFAGSTIRNSWASPLAAATWTIRELALFMSSYISSLHSNNQTNTPLSLRQNPGTVIILVIYSRVIFYLASYLHWYHGSFYFDAMAPCIYRLMISDPCVYSVVQNASRYPYWPRKMRSCISRKSLL